MSSPSIAFIGLGRLGATLARALHRAGEAVTLLCSRNAEAAGALARELPGSRAVPAAEAAAAGLVFITVNDDAIATLVAQLPWRAGQAVVHCSGATEVAALQAAADAGALTGGFHPLQIFSDPARALALLPGSSVAIEGPPALEAELQRLARVLGMHPLHLPPGARALYHGSANFAASYLLSMLDEVATVWRSFGIEEAEALQALVPMARGTLDAALSKGLSAAVAGAVSRGDAGVVARHLDALHALAGEHEALYRAFAERQLALVQKTRRLSDAQEQRLREVLKRSSASRTG